ncbi:Integral membrane protein TerC [Paludibacter propionicigenes WB4]|uniref:Integral membrane protein TerC n=1 Tax=Paludibacter propionicigenes (strain DSM 17365 / JCM 13257 / WB4) TaxID=694427 RepID=E4T6K6_PALPW|nr:TerC family protein [Paludibacter propionicigenes]ADQ80350.1 Integral membrane protein TerC [Paludibacter propionicigenes WB4]
MEVGINFWIGFVVFVAIMLSLDLFVFHKKNTVVKVKEALLWSLFWIGLAVAFNLVVYFWLGKVKALEFLTGYLIEESLSVDNLFVFILIFGFFKIDAKYQHKILFWGIIGAIVMRAVFIFAGVAIIEKFAWVMYIFGAFLVYTGIHMLFEKEKDDYNPNKNPLIRGFKKIFPVTDDMSRPHFFIRKDKILYATPFFIALLVIEASDLIFAVDSIPAVLSVSKDPFIVYTSNIFAILGLRSLYFALNGIMGYFQFLKYALSGILTFIGFKMCINELAAELGYSFHISNVTSLAVIVSLLTFSILLSVVVKKNAERKIAKQ